MVVVSAVGVHSGGACVVIKSFWTPAVPSLKASKQATERVVKHIFDVVCKLGFVIACNESISGQPSAKRSALVMLSFSFFPNKRPRDHFN